MLNTALVVVGKTQISIAVFPLYDSETLLEIVLYSRDSIVATVSRQGFLETKKI